MRLRELGFCGDCVYVIRFRWRLCNWGAGQPLGGKTPLHSSMDYSDGGGDSSSCCGSSWGSSSTNMCSHFSFASSCPSSFTILSSFDLFVVLLFLLLLGIANSDIFWFFSCHGFSFHYHFSAKTIDLLESLFNDEPSKWWFMLSILGLNNAKGLLLCISASSCSISIAIALSNISTAYDSLTSSQRGSAIGRAKCFMSPRVGLYKYITWGSQSKNIQWGL